MSNEFKRTVCWNSYQIIPAKVINKGTNVYELLSASFHGVKRLFVLAYTISVDAGDEAVMKKQYKVFSSKRKNLKLQRID